MIPYSAYVAQRYNTMTPEIAKQFFDGFLARTQRPDRMEVEYRAYVAFLDAVQQDRCNRPRECAATLFRISEQPLLRKWS